MLVLQLAVPDVKEAAKGANVLVFVLPHQFVRGVCTQLKGTLAEGTIAVTLIKVSSSRQHGAGLGCMTTSQTQPSLRKRFHLLGANWRSWRFLSLYLRSSVGGGLRIHTFDRF